MIKKLGKKLELNKVTVSNVQGGTLYPMAMIKTVTNILVQCCKVDVTIDPMCTMENC